MNGVSNECLAHGHEKLAVIWTSLSEDILRYINKSPENKAAGDDFKHRLGAFLTPNLLCLFLYRISHYLYVNNWRRLARWVVRLNLLVHKVSIPMQSCIGPGCFLPHPAGVTFCGRAGRDLTLYALSVCCPLDAFVDGPVEAGPHLGDGVTVGGHAVVLGSITVGNGSKIVPGVRLDRDTPPGVIVVSRIVRPTIQRRIAETETPIST